MAASDCRDKALALLSRRSHFRRQLEEKLRSRRYDDAEIARTLEELTRLGFLDDLRVTREFVDARLRRGPIGRRRMRLELERRGADKQAVEETLQSVYAERSDLEATREAAAHWLRRGGGDVGRLARHLDRLGFTSGSILSVLDEERARRDASDER